MRRMTIPRKLILFPLAFSVPIRVIAHHRAVVLGNQHIQIDLTDAQIPSVDKFFEVTSDKFSECVIAVPGSLQALAAWLRKLPGFSSRKGSSLRGARPSRFSSVSAGPAAFPLL